MAKGMDYYKDRELQESVKILLVAPSESSEYYEAKQKLLEKANKYYKQKPFIEACAQIISLRKDFEMDLIMTVKKDQFYLDLMNAIADFLEGPNSYQAINNLSININHPEQLKHYEKTFVKVLTKSSTRDLDKNKLQLHAFINDVNRTVRKDLDKYAMYLEFLYGQIALIKDDQERMNKFDRNYDFIINNYNGKNADKLFIDALRNSSGLGRDYLLELNIYKDIEGTRALIIPILSEVMREKSQLESYSYLNDDFRQIFLSYASLYKKEESFIDSSANIVKFMDNDRALAEDLVRRLNDKQSIYLFIKALEREIYGKNFFEAMYVALDNLRNPTTYGDVCSTIISVLNQARSMDPNSYIESGSSTSDLTRFKSKAEKYMKNYFPKDSLFVSYVWKELAVLQDDNYKQKSHVDRFKDIVLNFDDSYNIELAAEHLNSQNNIVKSFAVHVIVNKTKDSLVNQLIDPLHQLSQIYLENNNTYFFYDNPVELLYELSLNSIEAFDAFVDLYLFQSLNYIGGKFNIILEKNNTYIDVERLSVILNYYRKNQSNAESYELLSALSYADLSGSENIIIDFLNNNEKTTNSYPSPAMEYAVGSFSAQSPEIISTILAGIAPAYEDTKVLFLNSLKRQPITSSIELALIPYLKDGAFNVRESAFYLLYASDSIQSNEALQEIDIREFEKSSSITYIAYSKNYLFLLN